MRRRYKVYIVIAIILVSIYFGLQRSNLLDVVRAGDANIVNMTPVTKSFELLPNLTRYSIYLNAREDAGTVLELEEMLYRNYTVQEEIVDSTGAIIQEMAVVSPIVKKKFNVSSQVVAYAVIVPGEIGDEVLASIRSLNSYTTFEVEIRDQSFIIDFEKQIDNRGMAIDDLRNKLGDSRFFNSTMDIHNSINQLQNDIDSLRSEESQYLSRKNDPAFKIIVQNVGGSPVSMTRQIYGFFKNFVISFAALTMLLFLTYFALAIILRLMSYLGIRTSKSGGGGGYGGYSKYNTRYGSYGGRYGQYGRRRKVKRVYKNREESEKKETDGKPESDEKKT
ncbi:MAG: hypothetical protein K8R90_11460 [Candidatus Cloacimonetes bacterium]|nr:hypothetical protein [Candidatus Cloacimonadota bacterium]